MQAIFLDFDGVLCNSIDEVYYTSMAAFEAYENAKLKEDNRVYETFKSYRGLVGPAGDYLILWLCIRDYLEANIDGNSPSLFSKKWCFYKENVCLKDINKFEALFFSERNRQRHIDIKQWSSLHKLTELGQLLQKTNNESTFILTAKDRESIKVLLSYFEIEVKNIYSREDYEKNGTKGDFISMFLDQQKYSSAIFVDDFAGHLKNINDSRIDGYFAPWGFGENDGLPVCSFSIGDKDLLTINNINSFN